MTTKLGGRGGRRKQQVEEGRRKGLLEEEEDGGGKVPSNIVFRDPNFTSTSNGNPENRSKFVLVL